MRTQLIEGPADDPLTLDEVRQHLRNPEATGNAADEELYRNIQTAREWAEHTTGYALMTQTWDVYLDGFPVYGRDYWQARPLSYLYPAEIELPFPPLQSVVSVKYRDSAWVLQTVTSTDYETVTAGIQASIKLAYGKSWPSVGGVSDSVVVRIKVGWQDAEFIPASIRSWMLLAIEWMDKNRGLSQDREAFVNSHARRLLDRYSIPGV